MKQWGNYGKRYWSNLSYASTIVPASRAEKPSLYIRFSFRGKRRKENRPLQKVTLLDIILFSILCQYAAVCSIKRRAIKQNVIIAVIVEIKIIETGKPVHVPIDRILIIYLIAHLGHTSILGRAPILLHSPARAHTRASGPHILFSAAFGHRHSISRWFARMLRWTTFVDVEVGRSRSGEFTWNCPYKEKVDLCGILWSQSRIRGSYPVIRVDDCRIASHWIKFKFNYLSARWKGKVYCISRSSSRLSIGAHNTLTSQYRQITLACQLFASCISLKRESRPGGTSVGMTLTSLPGS